MQYSNENLITILIIKNVVLMVLDSKWRTNSYYFSTLEFHKISRLNNVMAFQIIIFFFEEINNTHACTLVQLLLHDIQRCNNCKFLVPIAKKKQMTLTKHLLGRISRMIIAYKWGKHRIFDSLSLGLTKFDRFWIDYLFAQVDKSIFIFFSS